ncbi:VWA domain-containing protein [Corallococcus praedator]|uniref:VWA domain-containing protein n=1 Tax=Corallococcus praedator TaxID=2316724 RepID=A0ABX9QDN0_9BACT|nr:MULTISPECIES: adventurous gliding motility lipoprotein CglB [Corallococcus]RKG99691.1 VWA domain-containing protein [Corallococcus sp. CA047B]RKH32660.1 VWA domain-containing protein [Corallococcus sp. CA031C]RKI03025.1 VWA domain-containing protein [Corallococcus praedator]
MRAKSTPLSALLAGIVGGAMMAGCQTYDFEPVDPLAIAQTTKETVITARGSKPDVMLLVDTSGSMTLPVEPELTVNGVKVCHGKNELGQDYICGENRPPCDTAKCPTRWSELQAAMGPFLTESGSLVRFGLTTYPAPITVESPTVAQLCAAAGEGGNGSVRLAIPTTLDSDLELLDHAKGLNAILQAIPNSGENRPRGGTPTSGSLAFTGSLLTTDPAERPQIIILLTDGLPNCNVNNEYNGSQAEQCSCTVATSQCVVEESPYYKRGCLDKNASVAAVQALKERQISTIVIGFGAETSEGAGPQVLNAMAGAGGFARTCRADIDCGAGDTCNVATQLCGRGFYQAGNQVELAAALKSISERLMPGEPCYIPLDPSQMPSDPSLIVVYINGERTLGGPDSWSVVDTGVRFTGSTCTRLEASRPEAPVSVEVRAIREL